MITFAVLSIVVIIVSAFLIALPKVSHKPVDMTHHDDTAPLASLKGNHKKHGKPTMW